MPPNKTQLPTGNVPIPNSTISDIILAFPLVLGLMIVTLSHLCSGWNEGSQNGICIVSFLSPLYHSVMGLGLLFAFTGFLILPVIIIFFILSTLNKVKVLSQNGLEGAKKNWVGFFIWLAVISLFLAFSLG